MFLTLLVISGGRNESDYFSSLGLMMTTMLCGLLTELNSRPDETSNGERWRCPFGEGFSWFQCYLQRMIPHMAGFVPYGFAWWLTGRSNPSTNHRHSP